MQPKEKASRRDKLMRQSRESVVKGPAFLRKLSGMGPGTDVCWRLTELEPRSASRQSCFISPHTKLGFVFLLKYFKGLIFHPQVFYYVSPQRKLFIPDSHNTIVTPNKINYNSSIHLKPSLFSHFPLSQMSFCSWFKSRLRLRVVDASQVSCDL